MNDSLLLNQITTVVLESSHVMRRAATRIGELETTLNRMVLAHENTLSDSEGRFPRPDMGCPDCTSGTVPDVLNTGRCAYHEAKVLLGQI